MKGQLRGASIHTCHPSEEGDVGPYKTEALAAYPSDMCRAMAEALMQALLAWEPSVLVPLKSLPVGGRSLFDSSG